MGHPDGEAGIPLLSRCPVLVSPLTTGSAEVSDFSASEQPSFLPSFLPFHQYSSAPTWAVGGTLLDIVAVNEALLLELTFRLGVMVMGREVNHQSNFRYL